jgi:DNA-3-methyladenine glycosylase II
VKRPHSPLYAIEAVRHLKRVDPILGEVIDRVGPYSVAVRRERFQALVRAIIFQQLAGRVAQTIFSRFATQVGGKKFPTPAQVLAASDDQLRQVGLSRGKMTYVRDLAAHVRDGTLNFHRFAKMDDEAIIADLTRVRGIGRWTAEMFLMFNLRRPDVLPVDDLGLRNAAGKMYALPAAPTAKELRAMGESWRPYRTAASWYLWQSTRIITPGTVAPVKAKRKARPIAKKLPTAKALAAAGRPPKTPALVPTS